MEERPSQILKAFGTVLPIMAQQAASFRVVQKEYINAPYARPGPQSPIMPLNLISLPSLPHSGQRLGKNYFGNATSTTFLLMYHGASVPGLKWESP
jgi:hypothetical protein